MSKVPNNKAVPQGVLDSARAIYWYRDEAGEELFAVVRLNGAGANRFTQISPDPDLPGRYVSGRNTDPVPYNLPGLVDAPVEEPVWVVEGERDCERLLDAGHVATTNPDGGLAWRSEWNRYLKDRRVVVVIDLDDTGLARGAMLEDQLLDVAVSVVVLAPTGEPDSGRDLSDHLAEGFGLDELRLVAPSELTPHRKPQTPRPAVPSTAPMVYLDDDRRRRYLETVVERELATLRSTRPGDRNNALFRAACVLYSFVAGGELDQDETTAQLHGIAEGIGLRRQESRRTLQSAERTAAKTPRTVPEAIAGRSPERVSLMRDQFLRVLYLPWGAEPLGSVLVTVLDVFLSDPDVSEHPGERNLALWAGVDEATVRTCREILAAAGLLRHEEVGEQRGSALVLWFDLDRLVSMSDREVLGLAPVRKRRVRPATTSVSAASPCSSPEQLLGVGFEVHHERSRLVRQSDVFGRGGYSHSARQVFLQAPGRERGEVAAAAGLTSRTASRWIKVLLGDGVLEVDGSLLELSDSVGDALAAAAVRTGTDGRVERRLDRAEEARRMLARYVRFKQALERSQERWLRERRVLVFTPPPYKVFKDAIDAGEDPMDHVPEPPGPGA